MQRRKLLIIKKRLKEESHLKPSIKENRSIKKYKKQLNTM